jgi:hypothetical protein
MKFVSMFVLLTLLLSAGSGKVMGLGSPMESVPARVPTDQVPDEVNVAGVSVQVPPSKSELDVKTPVPKRVPDDEVPDRVNKVEYTKQVRALGMITYRYGFYWYQYTPGVVAVAGFAQTETDFCAERLYARARLYRDVEHDGTWEFMDIDPSESTGACVKDSGEAKTDFWTAPNGTDWKVRSEHATEWDDQKDTWNGQKVDSFP